MIPAVPSFSVDDGFWYSVPSHLAESVQVGSVVRVPLSGRRIKGYVVQLGGERSGTALKGIAAVSGDLPVFDRRLLEALNWAALHYVAPVSVLLERAAPPNVPRGVPTAEVVSSPSDVGHPLAAIAAEAVEGRRRPPAALVGRWHDLDWLSSLLPVTTAGRSCLLVAATETEARQVAGAATQRGVPTVLAAGEADRELTAAWGHAQQRGRVVVGTPRVAAWKVAGLALAMVLEEGRRAMKDRQTPTLHVRELLMTRARVEGFSLVFHGPTPSLEVLAAGTELIQAGGRPWPLVEVVDRNQDPPGSGLLAERTVAALRAVTERGGSAFLFTHRRAADASMRCVRCRRVRACARCGSRLGRESECRRCGLPAGPCSRCGGEAFEEMGSIPQRVAAEAGRRLGRGVAGSRPERAPIVAGTERDLVAVGPQDLVVAIDVDGLMLGHDYRAPEEALRVLVRAANLLRSGPGKRMMAQTSMPDSPLIAALRRGEPLPYLESLLADRAALGLPPASEMLALEIRGEGEAARLDREIRALDSPTVLGPAETMGGWRWLIQGRLGSLRRELRPVVQRWRDSGLTVRVDVDPIDL